MPTNSPESIAQTAQIALEHDVQLCVHAIGARANREVLNVYERAFKSRPGQKDLRWRVEHAQHLHPSDIPRFVKLGVIAAMQGISLHVGCALRGRASRGQARRGTENVAGGKVSFAAEAPTLLREDIRPRTDEIVRQPVLNDAGQVVDVMETRRPAAQPGTPS